MFNNVAGLDRVLVKAYQDIEASYVPYLQSRVDPLLNIVRACAQRDLFGSVLEAYIPPFRVETSWMLGFSTGRPRCSTKSANRRVSRVCPQSNQSRPKDHHPIRMLQAIH
jgi:hypothetical protein